MLNGWKGARMAGLTKFGALFNINHPILGIPNFLKRSLRQSSLCVKLAQVWTTATVIRSRSHWSRDFRDFRLQKLQRMQLLPQCSLDPCPARWSLCGCKVQPRQGWSMYGAGKGYGSRGSSKGGSGKSKGGSKGSQGSQESKGSDGADESDILVIGAGCTCALVAALLPLEAQRRGMPKPRVSVVGVGSGTGWAHDQFLDRKGWCSCGGRCWCSGVVQKTRRGWFCMFTFLSACFHCSTFVLEFLQRWYSKELQTLWTTG